MREIKFREWDFGVPGIRKPGWTYFGYIDGIWQGTIYRKPHESQGQFTGLLDKQGKEIYEGDIVKATGQGEFYLQVIEFHNTEESCGRGWIGRNLKQLANPAKKTPEKDMTERFSYFCWPAAWEVIGNIYENKGLLNDK